MLHESWRDRRLRIADRTWVMMALIGVVLSDQPEIRRNREFRQLADRARVALFELYQLIDPHEASTNHKPNKTRKKVKRIGAVRHGPKLQNPRSR